MKKPRYLHKTRKTAGGLSSRSALEKFGTMQMIDVHLPVRGSGQAEELVMPRYTQPDKDLALLLTRLNMELPAQPPPKIRAAAVVGQTF